MSKTNKLLIETSAIRAKVGPTTKAHEEAFDQATSSAKLYTSTYIRMEFIRRWICDQILIAETVRRFGDVSEALVFLEQDFKPRSIKSYLACIAKMLQDRNSMNDTEAASEELARSAFHWLRLFDKCFPSRIQNKTRCQRGGRELKILDASSLLSDLTAFQLAFETPVTDCEVNAFLNLGDPRSQSTKLSKLVSENDVGCVKHLKDYVSSNKFLTCTQCERIGDVLIALEQTKSYSLVHTDGSFDFLCDARKMPHVKVPSVRGAQKIADSKNTE